MARYQYVILASAVEGQQEEFERWYDEQHLGDVLKVPGVVAAKRFRVIRQFVTDLQVPKWCSLAMYEFETDNPKAVIANIRSLSGTDAMPLSDALDRNGLIQLVAEPIG